MSNHLRNQENAEIFSCFSLVITELSFQISYKYLTVTLFPDIASIPSAPDLCFSMSNSDRSGYSGSDSEDNRSHYDQHSDDRDDSGSESDEEQSGGERDDDGALEAGEIIEPTSIVDYNHLKLCDQHKPGDMTLDCNSCKAALLIITDKNIKKMLTQNSAKSGLISRYAGRCDDVSPTLSLGAASLEIGQSIFTKGVFKDKRSWQDVVKKYLTLPQIQHNMLTNDIKMEDVLKKYKNERRFKYIFTFQKDVVDILRNLRLSQRPLLSLIEHNHNAILSVRKLAEDAGISFPSNAPEKKSGNVPRDGHCLTDPLHVASTDDIFPRPDIKGLIDAASLNESQANKVVEYIEGYRGSVGDKYKQLFDVASNYMNVSEDQLVFYTDLYSHVDASLREVIREKMASLFRSHVKSDVLKQTSSKQMADKPSGFFGGVCLRVSSVSVH